MYMRYRMVKRNTGIRDEAFIVYGIIKDEFETRSIMETKIIPLLIYIYIYILYIQRENYLILFLTSQFLQGQGIRIKK